MKQEGHFWIMSQSLVSHTILSPYKTVLALTSYILPGAHRWILKIFLPLTIVKHIYPI